MDGALRLENKLYLAVDSGGSKTIWSIITEKGIEVFRLFTEGLGAVREGILPVEETIFDAAKAINEVAIPCGIHLSLGGPNVSEVYRALKKAWSNVPISVEREACGDSILYGAGFLGGSAVVMCGTGSTAVGNTENGRKFSGGWGPIYGDEGSGGGLGSDALKLFLKSLDGIEDVGSISELFSDITKGLEISKFEDRMEAKKRALNMSRRELASLAPSIYSLALKGEQMAEKLYNDAAVSIACMASWVTDDKPESNVIICGGFFKDKPDFIEKCKNEFSKVSRAKMNYFENFSPIIGVKLMVLKNNSITINDEIFSNIYSEEEE